MENILGCLAFTGIIAAQFLAVVAVRKTKRHGGTPAKADFRRSRPVNGNEQSAGREMVLAIPPGFNAGRRTMISTLRQWKSALAAAALLSSAVIVGAQEMSNANTRHAERSDRQQDRDARDGRGDQSPAHDALVATYLAWIIAQTGLSAPDRPPIHFVTLEDMARRYGSPENNGLELQALYNRVEGSIYLPQGWKPKDLRQKSALLHELVHHVQRFNKIDLPCMAAYERQAYELQIRWLHEQGVADPYELMGTNGLSINLVSMCPD